MRRTPQSALIEIFPPNEFNRDWETVVQTMGIRYLAWQGNQCVPLFFFSLPLLGDLTVHDKKIYGREPAGVLRIIDVRGFCVGRAGCRTRYHGRAQ
jgi:hypothetical protein